LISLGIKAFRGRHLREALNIFLYIQKIYAIIKIETGATAHKVVSL